MSITAFVITPKEGFHQKAKAALENKFNLDKMDNVIHLYHASAQNERDKQFRGYTGDLIIVYDLTRSYSEDVHLQPYKNIVYMSFDDQYDLVDAWSRPDIPNLILTGVQDLANRFQKFLEKRKEQELKEKIKKQQADENPFEPQRIVNYSFGHAIEMVKADQPMTCRSWNPDTFIVPTHMAEVSAEKFWSPHNKTAAELNGGSLLVNSYFMQTNQGSTVPYTPTNYDMWDVWVKKGTKMVCTGFAYGQSGGGQVKLEFKLLDPDEIRNSAYPFWIYYDETQTKPTNLDRNLEGTFLGHSKNFLIVSANGEGYVNHGIISTVLSKLKERVSSLMFDAITDEINDCLDYAKSEVHNVINRGFRFSNNHDIHATDGANLKWTILDWLNEDPEGDSKISIVVDVDTISSDQFEFVHNTLVDPDIKEHAHRLTFWNLSLKDHAATPE